MLEGLNIYLLRSAVRNEDIEESIRGDQSLYLKC